MATIKNKKFKKLEFADFKTRRVDVDMWWNTAYKPLIVDFAAHEAPCQKLAMPHSANSQCGKLLAYLAKGNVLTSRTAIKLCGGTEAARRIRNIRRTLQARGMALLDRWKEEDGTRFKEYYVPEWDLEELKQMIGK
jgi:hypothetical protein